MTRLYLETPLEDGLEVELPDAAAHHVRTVLRLALNAELQVFNHQGAVHQAELTLLRRNQARIVVGQALEQQTESPLKVTLVQSISRGERMDYTLQKAVELGVYRIVPVTSTRTVVRLDKQRAEKRLQHWRGIIQHAAEQSGRCRLPQLDAVDTLANWTRSSLTEPAMVLHPRGGQDLARLAPPATSMVLIAGPEGGFAEAEIDDLVRAGAQAVRLGPRILRTETAAVCALTACQVLWGDLA